VAAGLVAPRLRATARDELLQLQFTTGAASIFDGIDRVMPGETLILADGAVIRRHRLTALPDGGPVAIDNAVATLDAALADSVARHLRSDVPYGLFLSGGLDSAAVLALMARFSTQPVRAFTAAFDVPGAADEREAASRVAAAVGARHDTLLITEGMVWRDLPKIVAAMDDPAADYAIIPSWFLAREARREVKVVLSGEGGDELLAGYGRHRAALRLWWLGGKAMRARGAFDRLDVLRERPAGWRDGLAAAEAAVATPGRTRLMQAQALDVADWLPHDLLLKLDRCLMAHGVEGRTPFVDTAVAAALFRLPDAAKLDGRLGKRVLREWLATHLPAAEPYRRKQGFTVPIGAWIALQGERLGKLVAAQPGVAEVARPERVVALFRTADQRGHGPAAWTLLFYALWHQRHMLGRPVDGDVFEALAAR